MKLVADAGGTGLAALSAVCDSRSDPVPSAAGSVPCPIPPHTQLLLVEQLGADLFLKPA